MSPALRRRAALAASATVVLAVAFLLIRAQRSRPATELPPAPFFEVVRVDDDLELKPGQAALPDGLSTATEPVADGPPRLYFTVAVPPGMNNPQARKLGNDWIAANVQLPSDDAVAWGVPTAPGAPGAPIRSYWLRGEAIIDSRDLESVEAQAAPPGTDAPPSLRLRLGADGAARLKAATQAWIGKRLAFVLDGAVLVTPRVETALDSGEITLAMGPGATMENARALAAALAAGKTAL